MGSLQHLSEVSALCKVSGVRRVHRVEARSENQKGHKMKTILENLDVHPGYFSRDYHNIRYRGDIIGRIWRERCETTKTGRPVYRHRVTLHGLNRSYFSLWRASRVLALTEALTAWNEDSPSEFRGRFHFHMAPAVPAL